MSKQRIIDYVMNTPGNTNPNVLNSLLDEEMNDLPDTSSASAGDVLLLNNNKEAVWATPSSGGSGGNDNIFIVNATFAYDRELEGWSVTLDKTFAEIYVASNAGKIVLCIPYESASGATGYPCVMTVESIEAFATTDVNTESTVYSFDFGVDSNDDTYVTATTQSKSGGVLVVTDTDGTLDKTWQEIYDAFVAGSVRIQYGTDTNTLASVLGVQYHSKSGEYRVQPSSAGSWQPEIYVASSTDGYPTFA